MGLYTEWDINPAYKGDFSYVFLSSPRDDYNLFFPYPLLITSKLMIIYL